MKNRQSAQFVPRQYMLSKDFEVYYYNDTHFHSVGSHSHNYYEFYFFEQGEVSMELGTVCQALRQGDVIVVPPGLPHRAIVADSAQPYRRFVFWISCPFYDSLRAQAPEYGYLPQQAISADRYVWHFDLLSFNAIKAHLFSLLDELHADRFGRAEQLRLELCRLLMHLSRLAYEQAQDGSRPAAQTHYEAITGFIEQHLDEALSLDRLAEALYLSKYYISHLFQAQTGMSVHQYIVKRRLREACTAIRSGTDIGEVYTACGFRDYSSFYRAFHKEYGLSPSEYRKLHHTDLP